MIKLEEHDQRFLGIENWLGTVEAVGKSLTKDVKVLKEDVKVLKEDVHKLGIQFEDFQSKLNQVLEIVVHTNRMLVPREEFERRFENHDNRISAIEYFVRKTPENLT